MTAPFVRPARADFLAGIGALVVAIGVVPSQALGQAASPAASSIGGGTYPDVDSWIAIDRNGNVTVSWGKVEQGTGIQTAIAQLVADELDVPFASIEVLQGDTGTTPNQGYTAGSQSLMIGATPVRQAAAQARVALIGIAAQQLNVAPATLATRDGAVVSMGDPSVHLTYAQLVPSGRIDQVIPSNVALKSPTAYQVVGKSIPRVDIPAKVTGAFQYVQNVRVPGMVHARMVYPRRLGQSVRSIDLASLGDLRSKVRVVHKNAFVAVVAQREWDAVTAAARLKVTWDGGPMLPADNRLDAVLRATPGTDRTLASSGDISALGTATRTLHATYHWPYQSHGSIGPSCGVADVRPDGVTIWSGTEGTYFLRATLATLLDRPAASIVVKYVEASGAYGHNGADDAAAAAAVVSSEIGKPVRMQYMRYDETAWDPKGPALLVDLAAALDDAGNVVAWSFHGRSPTDQGRPDGTPASVLAGLLLGHQPRSPVFVGGDRNAPNNYSFPNQRVVITDLQSAVLRQSALRGLGGTPNSFANESFVDELAHLAGADPVAFRLRYLTDPRAQAVLQAVQPAYRPGRGVSFVRYENIHAYVAVVVDLNVDRSTGAVKLNHVWVGHDCGLVVNPNGLRNQIEGNVIQASSRALLEAVHFSPQGVTSVDWVTYPIFRFSDVPAIDVTLIDHPELPILGAGEATTTAIAPAIANAIFAQTGARLRNVPFTPDSIISALRTAGKPA